MTTIRDVAKACGVSVATVSGVLNNTPYATAPKTRERVLAMIRQMNYSPSAVARGLSQRRMNTIGVVLEYQGWSSLMADQHLGPIVDGIIAQNSHLGQRTLLYTQPWSQAMDHLPSFSDGICDGLLLLVPIVSDEFFAALSQRRTPFVIIGDFRAEPNFSTVDLDNVEAGRQMTNHLLDMRHTRIAMLRGDDSHQSSGLRAQGYREALEARGCAYDPALDLRGSYNSCSGHDRTLSLLDLPRASRPTALFCGDDRIALGARDALLERGVRIPEEMSLAGINASLEGAAGEVPLTTLRQPGRQIGKTAVEFLLAAITANPEAGQKIALPGQLVVRSSSGPDPLTERVPTG